MIPIEINKYDFFFDDQILTIQALVDDNKQYSDQYYEEFNKTPKKNYYDFTKTKKIISQLSVQTQYY